MGLFEGRRYFYNQENRRSWSSVPVSPDELESAARNFLVERLKNDPKVTLALFAADGAVRFPGAGEASQIAHVTSGRDELIASVDRLLGAWRWDTVNVHSVFTADGCVAIRYSLTAVHLPSGIPIATESMNEFHFDTQGKITQLIEFVDTAKAEQLQAQAL